LLPVIVGGAIAIAGGLIGPPFLHWLQQNAEKKRRRAEKFEELVTALYEHEHWLEAMQGNYVFGKEENIPVTPFAKAHAIVNVYFPEFRARLDQLDAAAKNYVLWMTQAYLKRTQTGSPNIDGLKEAQDPYLTKLQSVLNDLEDYARRNFQ